MRTHDYETDAEALPCDDCDTPDGARWDTSDGQQICASRSEPSPTSDTRLVPAYAYPA